MEGPIHRRVDSAFRIGQLTLPFPDTSGAAENVGGDESGAPLTHHLPPLQQRHGWLLVAFVRGIDYITFPLLSGRPLEVISFPPVPLHGSRARG